MTGQEGASLRIDFDPAAFIDVLNGLFLHLHLHLPSLVFMVPT